MRQTSGLVSDAEASMTMTVISKGKETAIGRSNMLICDNKGCGVYHFCGCQSWFLGLMRVQD